MWCLFIISVRFSSSLRVLRTMALTAFMVSCNLIQALSFESSFSSAAGSSVLIGVLFLLVGFNPHLTGTVFVPESRHGHLTAVPAKKQNFIMWVTLQNIKITHILKSIQKSAFYYMG